MDEVRILLIESRKKEMVKLNQVFREIETPVVRMDWVVDEKQALEHLDEYLNNIDVVVYDPVEESGALNLIKTIVDRFPQLAVILYMPAYDADLATKALIHGVQDAWCEAELKADIIKRSLLFALARNQRFQNLSQKAYSSIQLEERLYTILNEDPDSLVVVDSGGLIRFANPPACQMFARSPLELYGAEFGLPVLNEITHTATVYIAELPDRYIEMSVSSINWENGKAWLCRLRDMTDYHVTSELMRENEEKFKAIAAGALDAIIHVNEKKQIAFCNDAAGKIMGTTCDHLLNQSIEQLLGNDTELFRIIDNAWKDHKEIKKELVLQRLDGQDVPVDISLSVFKRKGKYQLVCIIRDISEKERTQKQLLATQKELENALSTLKANQQKVLQIEKLNSIKELAGALAHEFSQPLQALYNYLHLIQTSEPREIYFQKSREMLNRISELTRNLKNITSLRKKDYLDAQIIDLFASSMPLTTHKDARILIIDDEKEILETLIDIFNNAGYTCRGAVDGKDALMLMEAESFDLIISDVMMPRMSGPRLYRKLSEKGYQGRFIFLTGYEHPEEEKEIMNKADDVIHKPVSFNELLSRVEAVLARQPEPV
ncbi:MAG: response regulator [Calditrichaeota bacterium]|nr:MAG: response regulator [Calditrichota bacterium]